MLFLLARGAGSGFHLLQRLPAFIGEKIFLVDERDTLLLPEGFRSVASKQHVRRFFHDQARELDRIANVFHVRDRAGLERLALHDRGIELVRAFVREDGAFTGVEERVVLERADGRFHRVEAAPAFFENGVAGPQSRFEPGAMRFFVRRRHLAACDRARAAVDHQRGTGRREHKCKAFGTYSLIGLVRRVARFGA